MSSLLHSSAAVPGVPRFPSSGSSAKLFSVSLRSFATKERKANFSLHPRCSLVSEPWPLEDNQKSTGSPSATTLGLLNIAEQDTKISSSQEICERVEEIKAKLATMNDGDISISAYDTAWVAMVRDINGSENPQFPESVQWIVDNQLEDGSWGDAQFFLAHDRIISTLAAVVALKTWNIHPHKCEKGLAFLRDNISKLEDENAEHMPVGFEVIFPSLLEVAKSLKIDFPFDAPVIKDIYKKRDIKLTKIPLEVMHKVPTTLLFSLEGMTCVNWEKLMKLQCQNGSLLFSPASTAYALANTRNEKCLRYLENLVHKFNGGVPNVYPIDLFERTWVVDRLERLGISRYFQHEIQECLDYVNKYWTEKGISWTRDFEVQDLDVNAMGFRILRLHGYHVSPGVFKQFKKGDEFVCFAGQSTEGVTVMFNLFRASQILFPGESIMEEAKKFSFGYLKERQTCSNNNQLFDKWIITKDLAGEVGHALDVSWYASLPRVESRFYLEHYGGDDDVWIGKTLYRWYEACDLGRFGINKNTLLFYYFLAASSLSEQEKSRERLAWAQTAVLINTTQSHFNNPDISSEDRSIFLNGFQKRCSTRNGSVYKRVDELLAILLGTLTRLSLDAMVVHGQDIRQSLHDAWSQWSLKLNGDDSKLGEAELLVRTIILTSGLYEHSEELLFKHPQYLHISALTDKICSKLYQYQKNKVEADLEQINKAMQELTQMVLKSSSSEDEINYEIKKTFLMVAKTFYYAAYCDPATVNHHIKKVLFEKAG